LSESSLRLASGPLLSAATARTRETIRKGESGKRDAPTISYSLAPLTFPLSPCPLAECFEASTWLLRTKEPNTRQHRTHSSYPTQTTTLATQCQEQFCPIKLICFIRHMSPIHRSLPILTPKVNGATAYFDRLWKNFRTIAGGQGV
jgi:hypothetical protein